MRTVDPLTDNVLALQDDVFRLAKNRGITFQVLSEATGIGVETLRTYTVSNHRAQALMNVATFVKLAKALPPDLAAMLIEDSGYTLKPIERRQSNWLFFTSKLNVFSSKVCTYATDGFDHRETAELMEDAREIAAEAQGMAA